MITRNAAQDIWGPRTPVSRGATWPERIDQHTLEEPDRWVQAACVLCSNGCGCDIGVKNDRIVGVRGRAVDMVNHGRLGPKGLYGWQANNSPGRLKIPLIRRGGKLEPATWDEAMDLIVSKSQETIEKYTASGIGFYTSGQLFLEEYYTLAVLGKGGLGTPHMDGNTRLCTATAAAALKETFGSDGQPGAYSDIEATDCILHVGHNIAATDTVLWARILDRRAGPNPPKLIVVDPRTTATAREADLHLAPRVGTNLALLNGLQHLLIEHGYIDQSFIEAHTIGFDILSDIVSRYPPSRVEELTGISVQDLSRAAEMIGSSEGLLSTCLQGVYQSNQATAAACQINNLNLILGRIGRPGCGILQMNGQPTSQNTRETGADGDLPGFRNWANSEHIDELAQLWNVETDIIPHWSPPTHAMEIFHYCETGSIRLLWISATNPAVSMPNLDRTRQILAKDDLFVVAQDAFMTETTQLADVVLPAAIWGEKTGCFTNVSRVVHISHKAVDPPGEARSDLDIFIDYARRMDFRDKDSAPLIKWSDPKGAFDAWRECTRGRPCDYTGLTYEKLSQGSGIPWPCNEAHPNGTERMYVDLTFPTHPEYCEHFGSDLDTGAPWSEEKFRALGPNGRALLKGTDYRPPTEVTDEEYPVYLTTGRLVHHFHTRTKTGRAPELEKASPDAFVQIATEDASEANISEGDWVRVTSRRGSAEAKALLGDIEPGTAFIPFHFGYWDGPERPRAANELTLFEWDPVSKQPHFKYAAVKIERIDYPAHSEPESVNLNPAGGSDPNHGSAAFAKAKELSHRAAQAVGMADKPRAHLPDYIGLLQESETRLVKAYRQVRDTHPDTPDVVNECDMFAQWAEEAASSLGSFIERYGERTEGEPERLDKALLVQRKETGFDLLRDLHDLFLLANETLISATVIHQASVAVRDTDLQNAVEAIRSKNDRMREWLFARCRQAAPQILVVPS